MQILLHGGRCMNIPLRTGVAYELQRSIAFIHFHRPDLQTDPQLEYRLVSDDGSFDIVFPLAGARPAGPHYSSLAAHSLPADTSFRLFKRDSISGAEILLETNISWEDIVADEVPPESVL
ncbi:MAG: hypothetical protein KC619_22770 [Myxococcales bacterium]|nr:hypothetical protein [Myxococcales bacterium]